MKYFNFSTKEEAVNFIKKMIDDKEALRQCIREGGDINKVAKERGIELVTSLSV